MMFDNCCDCQTPRHFAVLRKIGGFAEYIITHPTTNPLVYLTGRRYRTATFSYYQELIVNERCGTVTTTCTYPFIGTHTNTRVSEYSEYINRPAVTVTGTDSNNNALDPLFDSQGYYEGYQGGTGGPGCLGDSIFPPSDPPSTADYGANGEYILNYLTGGDYSPAWYLSYPASVCCEAGPSTDKPIYCYPQGPGCGNISGGVDFNASDTCTSVNASGTIPTFTTRYIESTKYSMQGGCDVSETLCGLAFETSSLPDHFGNCMPWYYIHVQETETGSAVLSNEVNYTGIRDTLLGAGGTIRANAALPATVDDFGFANYNFYDYPVSPGSVPDPSDSMYDGSLIPATLTGTYFGPGGYFPGAQLVYGNTAYGPGPNAAGETDIPGEDYFESFQLLHQGEAINTGIGVLATWIIMSDSDPAYTPGITGSTYVYDGCVDAPTGRFWVPIPDGMSFDVSLYGTDGSGNLRSPIGRLTLFIPGFTAGTYDHSWPT